jgi:hypothetical protein
LTNEYYANDDFENDSSPERKQISKQLSNTRNSMSRTVAPKRRVTTAVAPRKPVGTANKPPPKAGSSNLVASKTFGGAHQPRTGNINAATRQEYEQLIDYMQNAINNSQKSDRRFLNFITSLN